MDTQRFHSPTFMFNAFDNEALSPVRDAQMEIQ
jgi:hypothetical protein